MESFNEMRELFMLIYEFARDTKIPLFGIEFALLDYFNVACAFFLAETLIWFYKGENGGTN